MSQVIFNMTEEEDAFVKQAIDEGRYCSQEELIHKALVVLGSGAVGKIQDCGADWI